MCVGTCTKAHVWGPGTGHGSQFSLPSQLVSLCGKLLHSQGLALGLLRHPLAAAACLPVSVALAGTCLWLPSGSSHFPFSLNSEIRPCWATQAALGLRTLLHVCAATSATIVHFLFC